MISILGRDKPRDKLPCLIDSELLIEEKSQLDVLQRLPHRSRRIYRPYVVDHLNARCRIDHRPIRRQRWRCRSGRNRPTQRIIRSQTAKYQNRSWFWIIERTSSQAAAGALVQMLQDRPHDTFIPSIPAPYVSVGRGVSAHPWHYSHTPSFKRWILQTKCDVTNL